VDTGRDGLTGRLHVGVALLSAWLIGTSPWIAMYRRVPKDPGFFNASHVLLGFAALGLAALYLYSCTRAGRWRLYFPWLAGQGGAALRDLGGLLRGRIPSAEGGGLFAVIEGLALLALLATALTGAAWYFTQGTGDAVAWRGHHAVAARVLIGAAAAHVLTVSLHLLELIRD
jgi:Prokaryotic cytochrome b561